MLSEKITKLLNEQVNHELYSAYLYLSMSNYLEAEGLKGFANWFYVQYQEETDHAMYIYKYLQNSGAPVTLEAIAKPDADFTSPMDVLLRTLAHEQKVTSLINNLATAAAEENDHITGQFLLWFVAEQAEELANCDDNIKRAKLAGEGGLFFVDKDLATRVYTAAQNPPVTL